MKLYHYGAAGYKELKTLEAQRRITTKEKEEALRMRESRHNIPPDLYFRHVSFFFEPVESDHWRFYSKDHHFWRKGSVITEYIVETRELEFSWMIVELPEITQAIYDASISDEEFDKLYVEVYRSGYVGSGTKSLEKKSKVFQGKLRQYSQLAFEKNPNSLKYAAGIPHVMIYPKDKVIPLESHSTIRMK